MGSHPSEHDAQLPRCCFAPFALTACPGYELISLGERPSAALRHMRLPAIRSCLHLTFCEKPGGYWPCCHHPHGLADQWWADHQARARGSYPP